MRSGWRTALSRNPTGSIGRHQLQSPAWSSPGPRTNSMQSPHCCINLRRAAFFIGQSQASHRLNTSQVLGPDAELGGVAAIVKTVVKQQDGPARHKGAAAERTRL
jgi:hypothetical protein